MRLSIVVPVFNERTTILAILEKVGSAPFPADIEVELIVVDDASTDGTGDFLEKLPSAPFRLLRHTSNQGKSAALRTGFKAATGDLLVVQDADLEYDPGDLPRLLEPILADEADVVYGSRFRGRDAASNARWHTAGNRLITAISNRFSGLALTDMETCYKLFRMEALRSVPLRAERFGFEPEVTIKLARQRRWRILEIPISYQRRTYAEGKKIRLRDAFHALAVMLTARFFQPCRMEPADRPRDDDGA